MIGLLRKYHEGELALTLPARIARRVRNNVGKSWNSSADGIPALEQWLLRAQNFRCVYCQRLIPRSELGLRELDHVLPKAASANCDPKKAREEGEKFRTHTFGYSQFTYEPQNLVVTCKLCNNRKRSYDPLCLREFPPLHLPDSAQDYEWVHPYFHRYTDHIRVSEEWLYKEVTREGRRVIQVCNLNDSETLARHHLAEALALQSKGVIDFLIHWVAMQHEMTKLECQVILTEYFRVSAQASLDLVRLWSNHPLDNPEAHAIAVATSANILQSAPPSYHWAMYLVPFPMWLLFRRASGYVRKRLFSRST